MRSRRGTGARCSTSFARGSSRSARWSRRRGSRTRSCRSTCRCCGRRAWSRAGPRAGGASTGSRPLRFVPCTTGPPNTSGSGRSGSRGCGDAWTSGEARRRPRGAPAAPDRAGLARLDGCDRDLRLADGDDRLPADGRRPVPDEDTAPGRGRVGQGPGDRARPAAAHGLGVVGERCRAAYDRHVRAGAGGRRDAPHAHARGRDRRRCRRPAQRRLAEQARTVEEVP